MRIIGLTGSIACGKSTVSRELRNQGFPVIDGDELSRELTGPGGAALSDLRAAFGSGIFRSDGDLDRKALGSLVFSDQKALSRLNDLMAPHLRMLTDRRLTEVKATGAPLCFLEMPLLFEQGYDALCDTVWCVWLPEQIQLRRLMARDHLSPEEAMQRMASVLSPDEKADRSRVVLDNSGTPDEMLKRIPDLLDQEMRLAVPMRRRSARYNVDESAQTSPVPSEVSSPRPLPEIQETDPHHLHQASISRAAASVIPDITASTATADSRGNPGQHPAPHPGPVPEMVERPASARRAPSRRKAAWRLPAWLMALLITCTSVLAVAFTAQCLMNAYLVRRQDQHRAEQQAIDESYPLLYRELIEKYAESYNLRPAYISAIIRNESSFRPDVNSSVGARGLMQLMPDTAEWIAHKLKIEGYAFERMYDPESNIMFGCWYLNYLSRLFGGDPVSVTCAYHAGQGEIASWLSNASYSPDGRTLTVERLPEGPTRQYAGRVTRDDGIYQKKYFSSDPVDGADSGDGALLP